MWLMLVNTIKLPKSASSKVVEKFISIITIEYIKPIHPQTIRRPRILRRKTKLDSPDQQVCILARPVIVPIAIFGVLCTFAKSFLFVQYLVACRVATQGY